MPNPNTSKTSRLLSRCAPYAWVLVLALGAALYLHGCQCECTAAACGGDLGLTLITEDGAPLAAGTYRIEWSIEDVSGAFVAEVGEEQDELSLELGSDVLDEQGEPLIPYGYLEDAEEISIAVFIDDVEVLRQTYDLVHGKAVCNECSGGPWCEDDTYITVEPITIALPSSADGSPESSAE